MTLALKILMFILARLREPSTHAGLGAMTAGGAAWLPPQWQFVAHAAAILFGGIAYLMREKSTSVHYVLPQSMPPGYGYPPPNAPQPYTDTQSGQMPSPFGDTGRG